MALIFDLAAVIIQISMLVCTMFSKKNDMNTHGIPTVMPPLWYKVFKGSIDLMSTSYN